MPLSRLENFLKNVQGNVIYVNPEELDATDDVSNTGNSRTRPFKTIQRALIESARFSYQLGKDNDKFDKTSIMVSPGVHYIDNRPGFQIDDSGNITDVNGTAASISELSIGTKFDIQDPDNVLYHFNSIHGGVILPRGTSIIGTDLRKTKIKPKYVPQPDNDAIDRSAIFRVTGGCFFFNFSLFDGDPADRIFRDYTSNVYAPNYSHHKLTCFEFADGNNTVAGKGNTDLDMYYAKLTLAYGTNSGRALPNYPANKDFQKTVDESRIVGAVSRLGDLEIDDIYSGTDPSASTATTVVTVITKTDHNLNVDTPVIVNGVSNADYDGSHVVAQVLSSTSFTFTVPVAPPSTATPSLTGLAPTVIVESDSVTSASPYVFNCSLRSVFGMCGMLADGSKATGFKSMVAAQFTGIGLQKDDNAFVKYNKTSGTWQDQATLGTSVTLHTDGLAIFKPDYENFHIKVTREAVLQIVSCFAVGYAKQFVTESGGDISLTNSNSNFGHTALEADGFKPAAFIKDDKAYITSIVPPKKDFSKEEDVNWISIDVQATIGLSTDTKLFLTDFKVKDTVPVKTASGFTVGNKINDKLFCSIQNITYGADILMPGPLADTDTWASGKKEIIVAKSAGANAITSNIITLEDTHKFNTGEKIRFYSDSGSLPDNIESDRDYFAITSGLSDNQIKVATTFNNATAGSALSGINNLGGKIRVVSTVDGKEPGEPGHPIQYDTTDGWYVNVGAANSLRSAIVTNQGSVSVNTNNTFIVRKPDTRKDLEKIYRIRFVVPDDSTNAAAPTNGFTIQESATFIDDTYYRNDNTDITSVSNLRTQNVIVDASWSSSSNAGIITSQTPHRLGVGNIVEINRLRSGNNSNGVDNTGFNGLFEVTSINSEISFSVGLNTNPGGISTITANVPYTRHDQSVVGSGRTFAPFFTKREYNKSYQIFNNEEVQEFKKDIQDGIYDLTVLGYIAQPSVSPFSTTQNYFAQNINNLRPSSDPDNQNDDPEAAVSHALREKIGQVVTNDPKKSVTKELIHNFVQESNIAIGITGGSHSAGDTTIDTDRDHGFNAITSIKNVTGGAGYGTSSGNAEFYYNIPLTGGTGFNATVDVTVGASGTITSAELNNYGSGYEPNDVCIISGVPFRPSGSTTNCTVTVDTINNAQGDVIQVVGVGSNTYNGLHRIINIENSKKIAFNTVAADSFSAAEGFAYHVGIATAINNIQHDRLSGIATVTLNSDLGLRRGDEIVIANANTIYNGTHTVTDRVGYGSSLKVNIGKTASQPAFSGSGVAHGSGISATGFNQTMPIYGGKTTTLNSALTSTSSSINLADTAMLRRGDYLQIEDEIVRITNKNKTSILRGALGTNATSHEKNVAARKIKIIPVETRRNSLIRASGHTFEYVGFGPGNYSTAMPQVQDRVLDNNEQILAQSEQTRGGLVVYTAMNDKGEFFIGRKKIDALTGEEVSTIDEFDTTSVSAPTAQLPTVASFDNLTINQNLYSNANTDIIDLKLRGNRTGGLGKQVFVGIQETEPPSSQTGDNILFATTVNRGGYIGWVQTSDQGTEKWQRFGPVSVENGTEHYAFDRVAIGQTIADTGEAMTVTGNVSVGSIKVDDLTVGRVVTIGTSGELQDSSSLTFAGSTLTAHTFTVDNNASVGVDATIGRNLTVTGITTAEHLHSTDDIVADDAITASGDVTGANIIATANVTATNNVNATDVVASGQVQAEHLKSTNDAEVVGVCTASTFVGNGVIPIGGIIMWSGTDGNIPNNWALCNGSNGTPNLVDRFIVGRGNDYSSGATGGSTHAIVPEHTHTATGGNHGHPVRYSTQTSGTVIANASGGFVLDATATIDYAANNAAPGNTAGDQIGQSGSLSMTAANPVGAASTTNANLPPYYAIAYIMRIS